MIKYIENENLFDSKVDALVNPVNCKGIMGKGIALEFKKRFPECMQPYKEACKTGKLTPGQLLFVRLIVLPDLFGSERSGVILFPTKNHWRDKSRIEWIEQGLIYLKNNYSQWGIKSISIPQIGCGLGGLEWGDVKPLIEKYFSEEPLEVEIYLRAIYDYKEKNDLGKTENYYFAYGSNMDQTQMIERCPKATRYCNARLSAYRFIINSRGVATIIPDTSKYVQGVLWEITADCEQSLDSHEGVKSGIYKKIRLNIDIGQEKSVGALLYIASDGSIGPPRNNYMEKIIKAAEKHGLEEKYVNELKTWLKTNKV